SGAVFFFSSRRRHTRWPRDWSSDVCSSDLAVVDHAELHWRDVDGAVGDAIDERLTGLLRLPDRGHGDDDRVVDRPLDDASRGERSEERRVGKEGGCRWGPSDWKRTCARNVM